jgi:hypothetical protein
MGKRGSGGDDDHHHLHVVASAINMKARKKPRL